MGWVSFLEDIENRLDDAVRPYSPPSEGKLGSISIESLRGTNDFLRTRYDELLKVVSAVRADISSKKQSDFCKDECVRLRKANFKLVSRLKEKEDRVSPAAPMPNRASTAPRQRASTEPLPQNLVEAKQRFHDARKLVEVAKGELKQAKEACKQAEKVSAKAQDEYQRLFQSERNSTKFVQNTGHRGRQLAPNTRGANRTN